MNMKSFKINKEKILDLVAWLSLASIFLWALAKSFGFINTPNLVEMLPFFGAVFVAGRMFQKMEYLGYDMKQVKKRLYQVNTRVVRLEEIVIRLEGSIAKLDNKI